MILGYFSRNIGSARDLIGSWRISKVCKQHVLRHGICLFCHGVKSLQAHHVIPVSVDASKALDPSNLRTLCARCHLTVGHLNNFRSYNKGLDSVVSENAKRNPPPVFLARKPGFSLRLRNIFSRLLRGK